MVNCILASFATALVVCSQPPLGSSLTESNLTVSKIRSSDGVSIAYIAGGKGDPALLFIHGGLADRSFWSNQLGHFADHHRVVALDLAGHGASGTNRNRWTLENFGRDVMAVVEREHLGRVILIGNSLGGAVALEAARLLPGRVLGVIAVDTCHDLSARIDPTILRQRAERFRKDFPSACDAMAEQLFHRDASPQLVRDVKSRMRKGSAEVLASVLDNLATYDEAKAAKAARVPVYCVNGDLYPTRSEANRKIVPQFKAVIMRHAGHYPMLERPDEFNNKLAAMISDLMAASKGK